MTEKYLSVSFGRFESFFIAYHVELSLLGQQTLVRRVLILTFFISLFISTYATDINIIKEIKGDVKN